MSAKSAAWIPRSLFIVQGVIIGVLGLLGIVFGHADSLISNQPLADVLFFHLSPLHSLILLIAGVASIVLALFRRTVALWAILQFIGFTVLFVYGSAEPDRLGLDTASHFLHLALMALAAALGMTIAAPSLGGDYHLVAAKSGN